VTGWSVSIADDEVNQILKSRITLFEVDRLSPEQLGTILRHEFGHSIGLVHSTTQEDLMYQLFKQIILMFQNVTLMQLVICMTVEE